MRHRPGPTGARLVQQADFDRRKANRQEPYADPTSLAVLWQRIVSLSREPIDALGEVVSWLVAPTVQQALPPRAEEVRTGHDPAGERQTAVASLRH